MSSSQLLLLRRSVGYARAQNQVSFYSRNSATTRFLVRYASSSSQHTGSSQKAPLSTATATTSLAERPPSQEAVAVKSSSSSVSSTSKAYADLAKARLSALVVTTTACGFLAAGGPFLTQVDVLTSCVVGTALCSSSAAAWNQILEIPRDKRMKRTQQRPLVKETITLGQAQTAATLWGVGGVGLLYVGTDPTTALLGASNIALYAGLYTWMKPRSVYNTWVGAVVGAIPPVMGWTAATGGSILDIEAVLLGSTLYFWQLPHFMALASMYKSDYVRGGFQMLPCVETDGQRTSQVILRNAAYLSTVPFIATATGVTSSMFALEGLALNTYALHVAQKFSRDRSNANARKVFLTSLWYLPSFMVLFLLHSKVWDEEENTQKDAVREWISDKVHVIRDYGRQVCIHEKAIAKQDAETTKQACPIVVGSEKGREGVQALQRRVTETAAVAAAAAKSMSEKSSS